MTNPKLHQILAIERDVTQSAMRRITDSHQLFQKANLLSGLTRTYKPNDDETGESLPAEQTLVQVNAAAKLDDIASSFERLFDVQATKDWGNLIAVADVVLEDTTVLLEKAPATHLIWLEKQLDHIITLIKGLPTLDPAQSWTYDEARGCYVTDAAITNRSKKIPRVLEKAPATDKHPAQVDVWQEDVIVGTWTKIEFSGALPAQTVRDMYDRAMEVREAVKVARSKANEVEVENKKVSKRLVEYIFGGSN